MGKKKSSTPGEENLLLPEPPSKLSIVDTHTHVASTFEFYQHRYKEGKHANVFDFVKAMYQGRVVDAVVDVWCEAPVRKSWKEYADAATDKEKWGRLEYWFVMGTFVALPAKLSSKYYSRSTPVSYITQKKNHNSHTPNLTDMTRSHIPMKLRTICMLACSIQTVRLIFPIV